MERSNTYNTGIASEYLILSYLYRMDLEAYISQGNKKTVDIRVIRKDGSTLSIDVKSVRGYSSLVVNNVEPKENHYIIFVVYNDKFSNLNESPDVFIVPSFEIPNLLKQWGTQKRVMKGDLSEFKDKWGYIKKDSPIGGEDGLEEEPGDDLIAEYFALRSYRNELNWPDDKIARVMGVSLAELEELPKLFEEEMKRRNSSS